MKKSIFLLLSSTILLFGNECICFELKGEFGEEIKAILTKYAKNLGDKNITVIPDYAEAKKKNSMIDSFAGIFNTKEAQTSNEDMDRAAKIFYSQCSSCHGEKGEKSNYSSKGVPINTLSKEKILDALFSYQDGSYTGASRFVKNSATTPLRKIDLENLATYITKLKETK